MFNNPIFESAFKELDSLCEQDFNLATSDPDEVKDFIDSDEGPESSVDVIDIDAEDEADLENSNVGKIILQCPCCSTIICKNTDEIDLPEDVDDDTTIDEDTLVQLSSQEECPVCFSEQGYKIIGRVAPYEEVEVEIEPKEDNSDEEVTDETDVVEDSDSAKDELEDTDVIDSDEDSKKDTRSKDDDIDESLTESVEDLGDGQCAFYVNKNIDECDSANCTDSNEDDSLTEGLNDINLETDTDRISIHAEQKADNGEEMIAPLDYQSANEIVDSQIDDEDTDTSYLDDVETEDSMDEPAEDSINSDSDTYADIDVNDVDEDSLDGLGESYLKQVYNNVKSYVTESISERGNSLLVEGTITFNSGKSYKTQFVVEGKTITPNGKCIMLAENLQITPGQKAFTIMGKLNKGKFIAESLSYNHKYNSAKVQGTVNV